MAILVNGNGNARVYAAQDADLIASITGNTTVRTSVGNKMAATAADASTISVADGVILTKEGRRIQLDAGQTDLFTIPTGSVGVTNYYIIGYKLTTDSDNVQVAETFVQLMASSTDTIPEGTFRGGDSEVYVSVARVEQDGVNLGTITALLPELETISELNNDLGQMSFRINNGVAQYSIDGGTTWINMGGGNMPRLNFTTPLYTFDSTHLTYTCTKDCYLVGTLIGAEGSACSVNSKTLARTPSNTFAVSLGIYPLSSGDVVTFTSQDYASAHVLDVASN